ncbi:MAG: hypothetical protein A2846_05075 [Candidatus Doudnabacteria bacterium RIFCSPHIGHO2_01_FULL_49_9]|nr:MAG: hypothetical protein A2846_05075 [Candidatus Doudnabacteria bacterium RIFCSPHIGHO2_01_FULL_49_9]
MQYPGRLLVDAFAMIARCGILLLLYSRVFQLNGGTIGGITFNVAAWSMFFYFSFSVFRLRDISKAIMQDVRSGNVETLFNKPISYLLYRVWWQIGMGLFSFVAITIVGVVVLVLIVGLPTTMTTTIFILTIIPVFLGATMLSLAIYSIIGLLAFWIEEITPIFWIVDKAVMMLGGSFLPFALFPDFMKKLTVYSPFGASQFMTHAVYDSWAEQWVFMLGAQAVWTIALSLLAWTMFMKARQKVSVNGG